MSATDDASGYGDCGSGRSSVPCADGESCRLGTHLDPGHCAHRCVTCKTPIHALCGKAVQGEDEGYGSGRLCSGCQPDAVPPPSTVGGTATQPLLSENTPCPTDHGATSSTAIAQETMLNVGLPQEGNGGGKAGNMPGGAAAGSTDRDGMPNEMRPPISAGIAPIPRQSSIDFELVEQGPDNNNLQSFGKRLEEEKSGIYLEGLGAFLYTSVPGSPELCVLNPGTLAIAGKRGTFLDKLVTAQQASMGFAQQYVIDCRAPKKQLYVRCSCAGFARSRKRAQSAKTPEEKDDTPCSDAPRLTRNRESKKTGCPARVYWKGKSLSECNLTKSEGEKVARILALARNSDAECCIWEATQVSHSHNHGVRRNDIAVNVTYDSRDSDVIGVLQTFLALVRGKRSRGLIFNAKRYLEAQLPGRIFGENVIRNSLQHIQNQSEEAKKLVERMLKMQSEGDIEFFSYSLSACGVLEYMSWAPKGAKNLVRQYGKDTCSTDATHKVSKFTLKMWGVLLLDADQHSRPVFLSLILNENVPTFRKLLDDYMRCFEVRLPSVMFSDNDPNFSAALATIIEPPTHLLCLWHLIDQSLKQHVASSLPGGASSFASFRKDVMLVRDVAEVTVAERLWSELLTSYFSDPVGHKRAHAYMKLMYDWRLKWWISHNLDAPTMGMLSTQRSEGWHAIVKAVTSVYMSLESFVLEVSRYVSTIDEKADMLEIHRPSVSEGSFTGSLVGKKAVQYLENKAISKRALELLEEESKSSLSISVYLGNSYTFVSENEVKVTMCYPDYVSLKAGVSTPECDLMRHYSRPIVQLCGSPDGIRCSCSCNYPQRMGLPCRHALACARFLQEHLIAFDGGDRGTEDPSDMRASLRNMILSTEVTHLRTRSTSDQSEGDAEFSSSNSMLYALIRGSVRVRWFYLKKFASPNEQEKACSRPSDNFEVPTLNASQNRDEVVATEMEDPTRLLSIEQLEILRSDRDDETVREGRFHSLSRPSRRQDFPTRTSGDGCPEAYGLLAGVGRNLAEALSRSQADIYAGAFIHRFLTQFLADYSRVQSLCGENGIVPCLPKMLQQAVTAAECDVEHTSAPLLYGDGGEGSASATEGTRNVPTWIFRSMCELPDWRGQKAREAFQTRDMMQAQRFQSWDEKLHFETILAEAPPRSSVARASVPGDLEPHDRTMNPADDMMMPSRGGGTEDREITPAPEQVSDPQRAEPLITQLLPLMNGEDESLTRMLKPGAVQLAPHRCRENDDAADRVETYPASFLPDAGTPSPRETELLTVTNEVVRNPPKRRRASHAGVQREDAGRDRATVDRRTKRARCTQLSLRNRDALADGTPEIHIQPQLPASADGRARYACPFCEFLKVQNNASNVKQHVATHHKFKLKNFLDGCGTRKDAALSALYVEAGASLASRLEVHPRKGARVEVFFFMEGETDEELRPHSWFAGIVKKSGAGNVSRLTKIQYDDGEVVEHDFVSEDEKWRKEIKRALPLFPE